MELGGFTFAQGLRVWAATLAVERLTSADPRLDGGTFDAPSIIALNDSGETWPEFGVAQLTTVSNLGNRPIGSAAKIADLMGTAGPVVVATVGDTADEARTTIQVGPVFRILTDGSTITAGARWGVAVGAWTITPDPFGQFIAIGADPITDVGQFWALPTPELIRRARPDSTITAGSSGTFSLWANGSDSGQNVTGYYDWGTDSVDLAAATDSWLRWDPTRAKWEWIGGGCEAS